MWSFLFDPNSRLSCLRQVFHIEGHLLFQREHKPNQIWTIHIYFWRKFRWASFCKHLKHRKAVFRIWIFQHYKTVHKLNWRYVGELFVFQFIHHFLPFLYWLESHLSYIILTESIFSSVFGFDVLEEISHWFDVLVWAVD